MKHIALVITLILLTACGTTPESTPQATTEAATQAATPSEVTGVTLTYGENAQVELVNPAGRHIYIDIFDITVLTKDPSAEDILLTTHLHGDHYYKTFVDAFPGQQLLTSVGLIELPDVTITGIASAHNSGDEIKAEGSTNYIYVIETGGLRIVHFGDIGQEALTDEQLAVIGSVNLAITQLSNSYSSMNAANLKGFNLIDQYQPRLILPTHSDRAAIEIAFGRWPGYYSDTDTVTITLENLPDGTSVLVLGNVAVAYGKIYSLELWK